MTISVSCSNCGKQFRNIQSKLAGKKARCTCGEIIRLEASKPDLNTDADLVQVDLMQVDLLQNDLLPNDVLPNDVLQEGLAGVYPPSVVEGDVIVNPDVAFPESAASPPHDSPTPTTVRSLEVLEPAMQRQPAVPRRKGLSGEASQPLSEALVVDDHYGDLDAILEGAGDASSVMASTTSVAGAVKATGAASTRESDSRGSARKSKIDTATLGFFAAIMAATFGFSFGILIVVARYHVFELLGLDYFSQNLQSANSANFGTAEISANHFTAFVTLGWLLWGAGLAMIVVAMAQLINAFSQLALGKQLAGWSDGAAATVGVIGVFLMVGLVFTQISFRQDLYRVLDEFERPAVVAGEHLPHVEQVRQEYEASSRSFSWSLLVGAAIPMAVFGLSLVRLFVKSPDSGG